MKIISKIKDIFRVEYRLAVYKPESTTPDNYYAIRRRPLLAIAYSKYVPYWTLYIKGPFYIKERPIRYGGFSL